MGLKILKDYNFSKKHWSYETELIAEKINQLENCIQLEKFELKLTETALKADLIINWRYNVTHNKNILLCKSMKVEFLH